MSIVPFFETLPELKDKLLSLKESFSKSPQVLSLTGFVLKQKAVSEEDYLAWAQKTYLLPWLKTDYFHLHSPDPQVWAKWKDFFSWRPDFVPLGEWDGVLMVGCLEKPEKWDSPAPVCFVLSSLSVLENWYLRYGHASVQESAGSLDMNDGDSAVIAPPIPQSPTPNKPPPPQPPKKVETLELMDDVSSEEENGEPKEEVEILEGFESFTNSGAKETPFTFEKTGSDILAKSSEAPAPPPPPAKKAAPPTPPSNNSVVKPMPIPSVPQNSVVKPMPAVAPKKTSTGSGQSLQEILKVNAPLASQLKVICDPMKVRFQKYMILSVNDTGDEVTPIIWTDDFYTQHQPGSYKFAIPNPCIFRIVAGTHKPFHGYITLNETNEKFFEDWNQGQIPDHATIVPVIVKDQLVGMVMALGEKSAYNLPTLKFAEKIVHEMTQKMGAASAKTAA